MATVGQQLSTPESGYQRIDNNNANISYIGSGWVTETNGTIFYGGNIYRTPTSGDYLTFKFTGTSFNLIAYTDYYTANKAQAAELYVDNVKVATCTYTNAAGTNSALAKHRVIASISGLANIDHCVKLLNVESGNYMHLDAIDIENTGALLAINTVFAPTNLTAIAGDSEVSLSWTSVNDATGYNVKRSNTTGGPYTTIAANVSNTTCVDNTAVNGITYYYIITALNGISESGNSNEASASPVISVPTNLTAIGDNAQVNLSWDVVAGATGYNVKRSIAAGGPYTVIANNVMSNNYVDFFVTNGTVYFYVVTALSGNSESVNSNETSATPQAPEGHALLRVIMSDSSEREYQLADGEIANFISWCNRALGAGTTCYSFEKNYNTGEFKNRKEYLMFERIISFEVMQLAK